MTRQEAIGVLKHTLAYESDFAEAKQMAIEALVREPSKEEGEWIERALDFVAELIDYIAEYPDDDYMTMECLCRKLYKHGLIDKKDGEWITDISCSEKPNN